MCIKSSNTYGQSNIVHIIALHKKLTSKRWCQCQEMTSLWSAVTEQKYYPAPLPALPTNRCFVDWRCPSYHGYIHQKLGILSMVISPIWWCGHMFSEQHRDASHCFVYCVKSATPCQPNGHMPVIGGSSGDVHTGLRKGVLNGLPTQVVHCLQPVHDTSAWLIHKLWHFDHLTDTLVS